MKIGFETKGLLRRIEKIPQIYKAIATLVLVAATVAALVYFVMMPQLEAKAKLDKEYSELQIQLNNLRELKKNMEKYRRLSGLYKGKPVGKRFFR